MKVVEDSYDPLRIVFLIEPNQRAESSDSDGLSDEGEGDEIKRKK